MYLLQYFKDVLENGKIVEFTTFLIYLRYCALLCKLIIMFKAPLNEKISEIFDRLFTA